MTHIALFLMVTTLQLQNGMVAAGADHLLSVEKLGKVVEACWEASVEDADCDREDVTLKLLAAYYGESGFDPKKRRVNTNHSVDVGIAQVNSVHLVRRRGKPSTFEVWCGLRGYKYRPGLIWDMKVNARFGAYVNVLCRRPAGPGGIPGWQYVYRNGGRKDQDVVYRYLARVRSFTRALEGAHTEEGSR